MKRFQRGLVVGKFAPLHRGHELVIRTALAACRELVLLSYTNPEFAGCEPAKRRSWLKALFPECTVIVLSADEQPIPPNAADDSTHRRFVAEICRGWLPGPVDAVFTSETYGEGFARELGEHLATRIAHVLVDLARSSCPISGTRLRRDVHASSAWLSPAVYASFVKRVCLLGGESSGKTTLAQALAARLSTVWAPEFGRELWVDRGGRLDYDDLLRIAREQVAREEALALRAQRFLFCDTSPLTTWFYCVDQFGRAEPELEALTGRSYDVTLLCAPDFPFVQDGTRRDPEFRARQHAFYQRELERRGVRYLLVEGDLERRVQRVNTALLDGDEPTAS